MAGSSKTEPEKMTRADWEKAVNAEHKQADPENRTFDEVVAEPPVKAAPEDDIDRRIEAALAKERAKHAEEMQATLARVPQLNVPAHSGGPGNDNHQVSWSLAEQEAAARGEHLDHWT
jgi:hypothetical protein